MRSSPLHEGWLACQICRIGKVETIKCADGCKEKRSSPCNCAGTLASAVRSNDAASRAMFAWSFDRLVPEKLSEVHPRYNSPWVAVIVVAVIAEVFLVLYHVQVFKFLTPALAYYFVFAVSLYVLWNLATLAGVAIGGAIGDPRRFGVDFAITATFIGIVVLAIRRPADIVIAIAAALVAGGLALAGASTIAVITAGALAPLIAVFARR